MSELFKQRFESVSKVYEHLIERKNEPVLPGNGVFERYRYPVLTAGHIPLFWRYDFSSETNPRFMERFGINGVFNAGAIKWKGKYLLVARVEAKDRKSFFAIAESPNGVDHFQFRDYPVIIPEGEAEETNVYDMRLTKHEDGWIYGVFCSEKKDPQALPGDLSSAVACAAIVRTKDFEEWERLPDIKAKNQQRNVVLHPEFVKGKYAFYTRPQDNFIQAGNGGGIGWSLLGDILHAEIKEEKIINSRRYHTIKELKNGEGPCPIKTDKGWLHLAHGVRECAAGLRYVLYLYLTDLKYPDRVIAEPAGYLLAPVGEERVGDVSNVLFSNGWIADEDGKIFIYYASSDTRIHVAVSSVDRLLDYCFNTPADGNRSFGTVNNLVSLIRRNKALKFKA